MDKGSMSHLIFFSRYQTNCVVKCYLDSWWHHRLWDFLGSTSKAMADRGKRRGGQKNKNLNISRTKRAF